MPKRKARLPLNYHLRLQHGESSRLPSRASCFAADGLGGKRDLSARLIEERGRRLLASSTRFTAEEVAGTVSINAFRAGQEPGTSRPAIIVTIHFPTVD